MVSFSSFYANQPFSSPPRFDIDSIVQIAENQASEAHDELWPLQTDPEYFYERAKYHEARWRQDFTSIRPLTHAERYSNISYVITIKVLIRAHDWQWLLGECRYVKKLLRNLTEEVHTGKSLPAHYSNALIVLERLLVKNRKYYKHHFLTCLLRSEEFNSMWKLTHVGDPNVPGKVFFGFDVKVYETLYKREPYRVVSLSARERPTRPNHISARSSPTASGRKPWSLSRNGVPKTRSRNVQMDV